MELKEKYYFFWKGNSPFSNWYKSSFKIDNIAYCCIEQYMMYQKAILFNDLTTAGKILETKNPKEHKALGREISNFDSVVWDKNKLEIVYKGLKAKFTQNRYLKDRLLNTKGFLVEASPYDKIWGIGLEESDPRAYDRNTWQGENLLGNLLTELREEISNESSVYIKTQGK